MKIFRSRNFPGRSWKTVFPDSTILELGFGQKEQESGLGDVFSPGERFAGRLKPFVDYLVDLSVSRRKNYSGFPAGFSAERVVV